MDDRPRAIVHLDLDAFYAAVEVLENPELEGKPVVVGGSPQGRGVVASASYAARRHGIRSAMPTARALALCPSAVILRPRFRIYSSYSRRVMAILREASPLVEQSSIDEACLDLTPQVDAWEQAIDIARGIQQRVLEEVGLSASLGVATNKLVAKVASDHDKPGGLTVVLPGQEAAFLAPLPVRALWGIGPVTARRLASAGITTVSQLAEAPLDVLRAHFGQHAESMARRAQGQDRRPLVTDRDPKSVSRERTFRQDLADESSLLEQLQQLSEGVSTRLRRADRVAATIGIKLRYADFTTVNRQMSLAVPTDDEDLILQASQTLFRRLWRPGRAVRLLGVAARHLSPPAGQLPLW